MKWIINLLLIALIAFIAYMLYESIREPIAFNAEKNRRENAVIDKLQEIRECQNIYRDITGQYAANFDTLSQVLRTDSIMFENIVGDPDSEDGFTRTVTYQAAIDSINALDINLDSLQFVPFGKDNLEFQIQADTLTYQQTLVNVVEVGTQYKNFMGPYASNKFSKYDNSYDPGKMIKFGNMNAPNTTGNWER